MPTPISTPKVVLMLAIVVFSSIAVGWFMSPGQAHAFDYVYALLHPAGFAAMAIMALRRNAKSAPWLVVLLLVVCLLDVAQGPHTPGLSAFSIAAGAIAVGATILRRNRLAQVGVVLCAASLAASLVSRLLLR
jgi:hypothetical protein